MSPSTRFATRRLLLLLAIATGVHFTFNAMVPDSELGAVVIAPLTLCWMLLFGYAFIAALRRLNVGRIAVLRFGVPIFGAVLLLVASVLLSAELRECVRTLFPVK